MWGGLDQAAIGAVLEPGEVHTWCAGGLDPRVHGIRYVKRGDFLLCRLPSGRMLHYFQPTVKNTRMPWTDGNGDPVFKLQVWYWTMKEGRWQHVKGYGGHWTENVVQATARDLLVPAMYALEEAEYPLALTIYDEALAEASIYRGLDAKEYAAIMVKAATSMPFSRDWPVRASAWIDTRYKKD